ncbi:hypothetical protein [Streptomyces catenulae]|uniref:Uncharacterized protein n=1 Tax=Streptomyces catenulae TaxID=66875 RepID=A0ABV2YYH3_9ACTN|nr:hypothetical protein [Streptomyces catenulae]
MRTQIRVLGPSCPASAPPVRCGVTSFGLLLDVFRCVHGRGGGPADGAEGAISGRP